jgi:hypothetical protein
VTSSRPSTQESPPTPIDREALQARYRSEREKRLRPDGNDQYIEPTGPFAHFLKDCYTESVEREPIFDEAAVVVVGGGFAGLVTAARLKKLGWQTSASSREAATSVVPGIGTGTRARCAIRQP